MVLSPVGSGEHKEIIVADLLLLVGQFEELIVKSVKFMAFHLDSKNLRTVFKGGVAASAVSTMSLSSIPTSLGSMIS